MRCQPSRFSGSWASGGLSPSDGSSLMLSGSDIISRSGKSLPRRQAFSVSWLTQAFSSLQMFFCKDFLSSALCFLSLFCHQPVCPERPHQIPVPCSCQAVLPYKIPFCLYAPWIFKPDYMLDPGLPVQEPGRLGDPGIFDRGSILCCDPCRLRISHDPGTGDSFLIRQRPVISVVRDPQDQLSRRDPCQRILYHLPHFIKRRHRHGRAISISPLIGHQKYRVCIFTEKSIVNPFHKKPFLAVRCLRRHGS